MKFSNATVTLSKSELRAILSHVHEKADSHHGIQCISIEAAQTHAVIVATDGHRLLKLRVAHETDGALVYARPTAAVQIRRDALDSACKAAGPKDAIAIDCAQMTATVGAAVFTLSGPSHGATFPAVDRVFPTKGITFAPMVALNCEYVADAAATLAVFGRGDKRNPANMRVHVGEGALDPVMFCASDDDLQATVIIMPVRVGDGDALFSPYRAEDMGDALAAE